MERILIIGGNAAGITAASRALRIQSDLSITVLESSAFVSYGICGSSYYIAGEVGRVEELVVYSPEQLQTERGIAARVQTEALEIQPGMKRVLCLDRTTGRREWLAYDKLLIATGARPKRPAIPGLESPGVFSLSRLEDARAIRARIDSGKVREALIIGGGYIGLELCEALATRGIRVTLIEKGPQVMSVLDPDMAEIVQREIVARGVELKLGSQVEQCRPGAEAERVSYLVSETKWREVDLLLLDTGVVPEVRLAERSGIAIGASGAFSVSDRLETSVQGIYAAGNCAETWNRVSGRWEACCLATVASKQGRVAGDNLAGRVSRFAGSVGTSIVRAFGLGVGTTGLNSRQALECGFRADAVKVSAPARAAYLPGTTFITVKLVFDRQCARLLGAQLLGAQGVDRCLDVLATALTQGITLEELSQLDLCYAPPYSQVWAPVHIAAQSALRTLK